MSGLDLYQTQRALALLLVYAVAVGFCLGGVYDLLRILRMLCGFPKKQERPSAFFAVLLFLEDVLFMLIVAIALILLCYYANDGQVRAPAIIGLACGFFAYWQTVGRLVVAMAERVVKLIRKMLAFCLHLMAIPVKGLWHLTVGRMMVARRERMTQRRIRALTESASRGFDLMSKESAENRKPPE